MAAHRKAFIAFVEQGQIAPADASKAAAVAGVFPSGSHWSRFLDFLLLCLGGLSLAFSVLLFVAFNWSELGRLARFALVESAMVLAFAGYWLAGRNALAAQVALLATGLILGGLLALFGQTYQTGADPWQLFFTWMLLLTPFALIGRFAVLWIVWAILANLSLALYMQPTGTFGGTDVYRQLLWLQFALNGSLLCVWEGLTGRLHWLSQRWGPRLLAIASSLALTFQVIDSIVGDSGLWLPALVWALAMTFVVGSYRYLRQDLFMLTLAAASITAVIVSLIVEYVMFDIDSSGGFLLIAITLIVTSTLAVNWLRSVHRGWQA